MKSTLSFIAIILLSLSLNAQTSADEAKKLKVIDKLFYEASTSKLYTGKTIEYFPDGKKKFEIGIVNGKIEGLSKTWYQNGQLKMEQNLKDGKKNGLVVSWYDNGKKKAEATHKDGKINGLKTTWFESGKKESESSWIEGTMSSEKRWNESGEEK